MKNPASSLVNGLSLGASVLTPARRHDAVGIDREASAGARWRASSSSRMSRRLAVVALLASWAWFGVHFLCTAVYLLPISTLTARLYPVATSYLLPYFRQRWSLFAPDPDGKTKHFQFRCRVTEPGGTVTESEPYNLSEGYYSNTWKTRLGPGQRVHRMFTSSVSALDNRPSKGYEVRLYLAEGQPEVLADLEKQLDQVRRARVEYSLVYAGRLAMIACQRQFPGRNVVQANAWVDIVDPPPFHPSAESSASSKSIRIDFGWRGVLGEAPSVIENGLSKR
jgi:hypothetical protein